MLESNNYIAETISSTEELTLRESGENSSFIGHKSLKVKNLYLNSNLIY